MIFLWIRDDIQLVKGGEGMEACGKLFVCSDGVLARYFRGSRDSWKAKTRMLRIKVKNLKRRVSDVSDSREDWKQRAKTAEAALEESQGEVARLQQALDESRKKRSRPPIF